MLDIAIVCIAISILVFVMYGAMVIYFTIGCKQLSNKPVETTETPFVSVVVAFRNEANNLEILINALASQSYSTSNYEIILVDDASTDQWQGVLEGIKAKSITVVQNKGQGKKWAVRIGIEAAKGNLIAVTDADCFPNTNWLNTMVSYASSKNASLVLGPVNYNYQKGFFQLFQRADFASLQLSGAGAALKNHAIMANGANMLFSKSLYLNAHLTNSKYQSGDDMFLLHHAKRIGATICYASSTDALVATNPQSTFKDLIKQRIRWASKTPGYSDKDTIITAVIVASTNVMLTALAILSPFNLIFLYTYLALIVCKGLIEKLLFSIGKRFFELEITPIKYWIIQIIHPFYTVLILLTAFTTNVAWKQRPTIVKH